MSSGTCSPAGGCWSSSSPCSSRRARSGGSAPPRSLYVNLALLAADLLVIAMFTSSQVTLIVAVIVSGAFVGLNNTLTTQAVMLVSPVERPVASAAAPDTIEPGVPVSAPIVVAAGVGSAVLFDASLTSQLIRCARCAVHFVPALADRPLAAAEPGIHS